MNIERFSKFKSLDAAYKHSASVISSLRRDLESALSESNLKDRLTVVTTGSFGRGEASAESDLDLFIFFDSDKPEDSLLEEKKSIQDVVDRYVKKPAGDTGTFGSEAVVNFSEMLQNLGGDKDFNVLLTRRMLFLLEGKWLYGEERFKAYRTDLLNKYIKAGDPERQISRFLLNDIIRYYRTIATDFEFKVTESSKSWGLRNVKLRFSRKLLYFGGVISVAETAFVAQADKNGLIVEILDKTVLERVQDIGADNPHTLEILNIYQDFLATIECPKNRELLEVVTKDNRTNSDLFLQMREKSKDFSKVLDNWLKLQYPDNENNPHPIHNALIF
ncbi:putative nucleotidyltransferase [Pseudomonas sp. PvP009]|uniref:nucleotidyltransferase domain-containing protein n=1 Tax=Pseudomonas sp. PvP009 TaxID=2806584 RepID=UPI001AE17705|nr:nucleotidyltransferase domain-containing protein [Pseudomonas sp. PvP009]MBP1141085.1 putative nucleotidyltransferase [Pseudomonas sp. PvP009]